MSRFTTIAITSFAVIAACTGTAMGASHLWRFSEIFTNHDGTIMFIEMEECCGAQNETHLNDKWVMSDTTGIQWVFGTDIPCADCTANKNLLLATQGFADLPGAPTPDYIIPDGLFSPDGDTLTYWTYAAADWTFASVPTCGLLSLDRDGTTGVNSPTNFAGETGEIAARCTSADLDFSCGVEVGDLLGLLGVWGCTTCPDEDLNDSGSIDVGDLLLMLAAWGPCGK